jgi:protein transport protein SEC24
MLVVSDTDEVFVPLNSGLFASPSASPEVFEQLISSIPSRFAGTTIAQSALSAALSVSIAALSGRGGQVLLFQATRPHDLPPPPNETEAYDTNKEPSLLRPREPIWTRIGEHCAQEGIGVTMFLGMHQYIDVGSIGAVASTTGGDIFFHPRFNSKQDGPVLRAQLLNVLRRETGYNCVAKIRCSNGKSHNLEPDVEFMMYTRDSNFWGILR